MSSFDVDGNISTAHCKSSSSDEVDWIGSEYILYVNLTVTKEMGI